MSWREPRSASPDRSIWRDLPEDTFRQHLVELEECTNAVPVDMQTFPMREWLHTSEQHQERPIRTLPLDVEQQVADDFAFLVAVEEGAQSVAACCLEEHSQPAGLSIRFAALDMSLSDAAKCMLRDVSDVLKHAASCCSGDATSLTAYVDVVRIFDQVVRLHHSRLLARLRSIKWQKPKYLAKSHKKPLWQDFTNLIHRVQHIYTKKENATKHVLESHLRDLASLYEGFEAVTPGSLDEDLYMKNLVRKSFEFCATEEVRAYAQRLQNSINGTPTTQVSSAIKCLRQVEKIAAYWRISVSLITTAKRYPSLFENGVKVEYLSPYKSIPTPIGYESWAKTCHVHAEVQLVVYYDLSLPVRSNTRTSEGGSERADFHRPRAIGTSKYLCYLCYQFIRAHKHFFPSNTHGRLYDQWTIPDLTEYDDDMCAQYRGIVKAMDDEVVSQTKTAEKPGGDESALVRWRAEPMTSRQNLLEMDMDGMAFTGEGEHEGDASA